eukprot:symbB.v1.2.005951.t1/scaffold351.1/size221948/2
MLALRPTKKNGRRKSRLSGSGLLLRPGEKIKEAFCDCSPPPLPPIGAPKSRVPSLHLEVERLHPLKSPIWHRPY